SFGAEIVTLSVDAKPSAICAWLTELESPQITSNTTAGIKGSALLWKDIPPLYASSFEPSNIPKAFNPEKSSFPKLGDWPPQAHRVSRCLQQSPPPPPPPKVPPPKRTFGLLVCASGR